MKTVQHQVQNPSVQNQHKGASTLWVLLALALGTFALGTTEFASMTLVPYIASDLGVDVAHVSYAISAYALGLWSVRRLLWCWRLGSDGEHY